MGLMARLGVGAAAVGFSACAALGEFASDDPGLQERAGVFKGSFVAVSDADMAATAYVDGRLEPFAGMADMATLLREGAVAGTAPASNSVVSWPQIVSRAKVGRSAEGFSLSRDGRFVATINMERTYLPELAPLAFWNGRRLYSVSLLTLDPATGALAEIDRIRKAGILPEDVIFDEAGDNLAVAVFHRRKGEDRTRGFIDFFAIRDGRLESQGVTQAVMRGAHDLVAIP